MQPAIVLQINPAEKFRLYDAICNLPANKEIVLHPGQKLYRYLTKDTKIFLWEVGGKDLVGVGKIVKDVRSTPMPLWQHQYSRGNPNPTEQRVIIRVEKCLVRTITRSEIQKNIHLRKAIFFKNATNPQGTCFTVLPESVAELDALIANWERSRVAQSEHVGKERIVADPVEREAESLARVTAVGGLNLEKNADFGVAGSEVAGDANSLVGRKRTTKPILFESL